MGPSAGGLAACATGYFTTDSRSHRNAVARASCDGSAPACLDHDRLHIALKRVGDKLITKKVVDRQVREILNAVWPIDPEWSENRTENSLGQKAMELYQTSPNLDNIRGTGWGVLQAVAEFADHEASFKGRGTSGADDVRANSILWGQAQWRKGLALKALAKL